METQNFNNDDNYDRRERRDRFLIPRRRNRDGAATGIFLVLIGGALLINKMYPGLPDWLFSWKTFLIALGVYLGYKHNFRPGGWIAPIVVGAVFIISDNVKGLAIENYLWPLAIIFVGLMLVMKPRFEKKKDFSIAGGKTGEDNSPHFDEAGVSWSSEDVIESTNIFSGSKKINISKNFKGGEVTNIFGGSELNLSKADIQGRAVLEVTNIFGGTKLIVPPDWSIQQEAVAIFGGIDDKRPITNLLDNPSKVLVLKGTVLMGGIDIRSY
ncbi:MAG: LiaF-related protein [Ferruginibacter sp.]